MTLYLNKEFETEWQGLDTFEQVARLRGDILRDVKGRTTLRFTLNHKAYFLKRHRGVGWTEIIKNLLQLKRPVLGADNEWKALQFLHRIGVETMTAVAYGSKGRNPATRESFIITEELTDTENLEDFCRDWPSAPPPFQLRRNLVQRVATMMREMHGHGMNHRDCYICHFHLNLAKGRNNLPLEDLHLHVIDLHRAQIRSHTPLRWIVKDLAGLYFSAMDIGLTRTDCLRFIKVYEQTPLRELLKHRRSFWKRVIRTALALYQKEHGRLPSTFHAMD